MRSVLLTFLMFAVLFGILKLNIVSLLDGSTFFIVSVAVFVIILGIAVAMFGLPTKKDFLSAIKINRKDVDDEKDK